MYAVVKHKFIRTGPLVAGGKSRGRYDYVIDRVVDEEWEIEKGELYFKLERKDESID